MDFQKAIAKINYNNKIVKYKPFQNCKSQKFEMTFKQFTSIESRKSCIKNIRFRKQSITFQFAAPIDFKRIFS